MRKINGVFLLICITFIVFFSVTSDTAIEFISNLSAWILLASQPTFYLFPKIKNKLLACCLRLVNYKINVSYNFRIDCDIEELKYSFERFILKSFENESDFRVLRISNSLNKFKILLNDNELVLTLKDDTLFVQFGKQKIGYRDIGIEIKRKHEIASKIVKIARESGKSVFECRIELDTNKFLLKELINSKIFDFIKEGTYSINYENCSIVNNEISYFNGDLFQFSNNVIDEILIK